MSWFTSCLLFRDFPPLEPINFPSCPCLHDRGLGTCCYEASSCLVICWAEEVLPFLVVWKFSVLASYQHQWNKWAINICLHLTAQTLRFRFSRTLDLYFAKLFACTLEAQPGWEPPDVESGWWRIRCDCQMSRLCNYQTAVQVPNGRTVRSGLNSGLNLTPVMRWWSFT